MPALIRISTLATTAQLTPRKLRIITALGGAELWPGSRRWYLRSIAEHVLHGKPLSLGPYGALPSQPLLHRAQVCDWLGITDRQFEHMLRHLNHESRAQICLRIGTGAKCQYRRDRIIAHVLSNLLP